MKSINDIVLASASPRRRELLERVGIRFRVVPSAISEEELPGESPETHVLRLSREKALEIAGRADIPGRWFIGSDTIVLRDGAILGKPVDEAEAATMLRSLSGREHRVLSGYAVHDRVTGTTHADVVTTQVRFKPLTAAEIAGYIATGEPMDKAGAYAIQGIGVFMVEAIAGSYTNVVGLPLCEVVATLERLGAVHLFDNPT
ncbi:Maf family protein [Trichloromonas sp.]|uniref:Maf family protein n=1 Tax=Trichloromonas sp. TaxID=3069249 RepID=UPI002A4DE82C|nr:Maf family nucleotide pyrophosphatase [Trichloromonas sp.]